MQGGRRFLFSWLWSRRLTEPPRPLRREERTPPPAYGGHLPFQGRLCRKCAKRLPPQRELSAVRLTEDKPICGGVCYCGG